MAPCAVLVEGKTLLVWPFRQSNHPTAKIVGLFCRYSLRFASCRKKAKELMQQSNVDSSSGVKTGASRLSPLIPPLPRGSEQELRWTQLYGCSASLAVVRLR